ncbi:dihydroorotate dehydrogenase electron transfer subunit [Herbivorax sp. ANBcel31]|uniref:dihydroorotate dehydrogenase electron transfer subunit n=1 Tax=Herbivorax sp. ANBcel31 TaxID=3069754 RepID=UPI0027B7691C|nr:dihydroorotate dehydrogenase electron transfer subunit [Herbivorax sp. ANBcel31]MDQ2085243.1 dihydroorotate dehydrogenase electron transfer subunit [Herbivorax sp. ANBcel31]
MSRILSEKVESVEKLSRSIYKMTINSEYIVERAYPGQFVNIKCCDGINALLRRPISICNVDKEKKCIDIVFQVKGIGTEYLSKKTLGDKVDLIGPLGNPFTILKEVKNVAVVGGGIGVFPLLYLLSEIKAAKKSAFLGFRNKDFVVLKDEFEKNSDKLFISTDDGSEGSKGLITVPLEEQLKSSKFDIIYTCGPTPMIKKVVDIAKENEIKCQVSLEQRMGCGIGACLVCACKTKSDDGWKYSHVCKDGPVFWSNEVIFDD